MKTRVFLYAMLLGLSSSAWAHPGHGLASASAGFLHPLTGWDHLLVMLAVGLWAGRIGGTARWQLPLAFLSAMAIGAGASMWGFAIPGLETGIAASVLAMGLLIAVCSPLGRPLQVGLVALFAGLHGAAHGIELPSQAAWVAMVSMLVATALLHGFGVWLATFRGRIAQLLQRGMGWLIALSGLYLLVA